MNRLCGKRRVHCIRLFFVLLRAICGGYFCTVLIF
uniref:Uncharacterized protein n=1 Tax=Siphoviridae sp. ctXQq5 TaxID=2826368 RepID=A0A8S5N1H1_9CAUD|nr:MAG TPA: hypothetical protein [Siphoviridae sp. ctXQq5]